MLWLLTWMGGGGAAPGHAVPDEQGLCGVYPSDVQGGLCDISWGCYSEDLQSDYTHQQAELAQRGLAE